MDVTQYQGLFYLSTALGVFVSMMLGLRLLAQRGTPRDILEEEDLWVDREPLEVIERIEECANVVTLRLKRRGGKRIPKFKAGQFLSLQIGDDEKLTRSYSISSSTANRQNVQISVKRLSDGRGSTWVHHLKVGDEVQVYPPSGHFTDDSLTDHPRVYIAGGIGITPLLSMIHSNIDTGNCVPMTLFYGMRSRQDLAFHSMLEAYAQRHSYFKYHPFLSHENGEWPYQKGFLTFAEVVKKKSVCERTHYFLCGPAAMTDTLIEQLSLADIPEERIHSEKFVSPQTLDRTKIPSRSAKVLIDDVAYSYSGQETLLEFLESQGERIPYACRTGVCGSCKCRVQGKTEMLTDAGLTRQDKVQGYVLTCVAFPADAEVRLKR